MIDELIFLKLFIGVIVVCLAPICSALNKTVIVKRQENLMRKARSMAQKMYHLDGFTRQEVAVKLADK